MESYVRIVNSGAYERVFDELDWPIDPHRSFLVSEISFCLTKAACRGVGIGIEVAYEEARDRLHGLPGVPKDNPPPNDQESTLASKLAKRTKTMLERISENNAEILFEPAFIGCGMLSKSYGDVLIGELLVEMKSVDRGFRATDFRQVLAYVFQSLTSGSSSIKYICVLNARRGTFHRAGVEQFVFDTSATSIVDIQSRFLAAVGFGGLSR